MLALLDPSSYKKQLVVFKKNFGNDAVYPLF